MGASRDSAHEDKSIQRGSVAFLKHCIDVAATMGATMVAVPIYSAVGRTWQATASQRKRDLERCTRNLKEVARYAEDKGVKLAMEPLNRFETSFINLAEQAIELAPDLAEAYLTLGVSSQVVDMDLAAATRFRVLLAHSSPTLSAGVLRWSSQGSGIFASVRR